MHAASPEGIVYMPLLPAHILRFCQKHLQYLILNYQFNKLSSFTLSCKTWVCLVDNIIPFFACLWFLLVSSKTWFQYLNFFIAQKSRRWRRLWKLISGLSWRPIWPWWITMPSPGNRGYVVLSNRYFYIVIWT